MSLSTVAEADGNDTVGRKPIVPSAPEGDFTPTTPEDLMKYLLSVHHRVTSNGDYHLSIPEGVETDDLFTAVAALNADLGHEGAWVFAGGLRPPNEGTLVDANGPEVVIADSPHAKAKEFLGGFWVIEAKDRETALDWARRASAACRQGVDVRPFQG